MANPSAVLSSGLPWAQAIGAVAQVASAPPAGPSEAKSSGSIGTNFDNSGWVVSYGDNSAIDTQRTQSAPSLSTSGGQMSESAGLGLGGLGLGNIKPEYLFFALVAVVIMKRKKSS